MGGLGSNRGLTSPARALGKIPSMFLTPQGLSRIRTGRSFFVKRMQRGSVQDSKPPLAAPAKRVSPAVFGRDPCKGPKDFSSWASPQSHLFARKTCCLFAQRP